MIYVAAYCWDCVEAGTLCDDCGFVFEAIERADDLEAYSAIVIHGDHQEEVDSAHGSSLGTAIADGTPQRAA